MKLLFANKALAYVVSTTLCLIEDLIAENNNNNNNAGAIVNAGMRKKPAQKSDTEEEWESQREKAMETVQRWLQLPLKNLWSPPIVEDSFVGTVSQICYKILEKTKDIKSKTTQTLIFQILSTLVKRYNHGTACVVRIIQLAKFHEALAVPIGTGVVLMATECNCTGLIKEIAREIAENDIGEADARNFGSFLEAVAMAQPDIVSQLITLSKSDVLLRSCIIKVLRKVVPKVLTGNNLQTDKLAIQTTCFDFLEMQILNTRTDVRSHVLVTWNELCCANALPMSRRDRILQACLENLDNNVAGVGQAALPLLKRMLQSEPSNASQPDRIFPERGGYENCKSNLVGTISKLVAPGDVPNVADCQRKCDASTQTNDLVKIVEADDMELQREIALLRDDRANLMRINAILVDDCDRMKAEVGQLKAQIDAFTVAVQRGERFV